MAGFCTNCGAALNDGDRFCIGCGSPASAGPAAAPVMPAAAAASATPKGTSSGLKVVLIVLGVLFGVFAAGIIGIGLVAHRVKNKVETVARQYGIDPARPTGPSARRVQPCTLITGDEAAQILGVEIDRVEPQGDTSCHYYGKAPTQADREREMAELQRSLKEGKSGEGPQGVENMVKALTSGMAGAGPYFSVTVNWEDGRTMLGAMKSVLGTSGTDTKMSERLNGIGDEAVLGPMASTLIFVKGATGVQIDLRMVPNGRDRGIAIAKTVASRLRL